MRFTGTEGGDYIEGTEGDDILEGLGGDDDVFSWVSILIWNDDH